MAGYGAEIAQAGEKIDLLRLSSIDEESARLIEDIRGHRVIDSNGESVGHIADLLIDAVRSEVRFLIVEPDEPLSLTHTSMLIPVETLAGAGDGAVLLACPCEQVADSPHCYPDVIDRFYLEEVSSYYGYRFDARA